MKIDDKLKNKSLRDNYSKGELAKEILKSLAIGGVIAGSLVLPNLPQVLEFLGVTNSKERYRIKRTIYSLEEKRQVNIYEKNGIEFIEITDNGRKKVLQYNLDEIKIERPKKWDGHWRVIIFDIPEKFKGARRALSGKLREMEIYPLQKSVFVCPFDCKNEVDFISEIFGVGKFVYYIVAKEINNGEFLKRHYNL